MTQAMVSAPQPEAVEAGLDILRQGGNVVDAGIGAALVQTAVDPLMCGIAGFGCCHLRLADGTHHLIDFHGLAPRAAASDMWEARVERECDDGFGFILSDRANEIGYQCMTSPMTLRAFSQILGAHGTRTLSDLIQPAIHHIEEGVLVRPAMNAFWTRPETAGRIGGSERVSRFPWVAKIYCPDGRPLGIGQTLRNPDMARTYRRIADEGIEIFYEGEIAQAMISDIQGHGGILDHADLANQPQHSDPLWVDYRGYRIATNQPPGGGLVIAIMLRILERFDLDAMGHNSSDYIATVSEAMKIATVEKDTRIGDPNHVTIPVDEMLSDAFADAMAERIRSGQKTHVPRMNPGHESQETTHICVADAAGNCLSMTHTLGSSSGSITDGLGYMYNNAMMVFDPRPGRPGSLAPGKARFSALSPTIVFKDGAPFMLLGAPGGTTITMGNLQAILNAIDFGMNAQQAVSAPRFTTTSDTIEVTNRIFRGAERELQARGYPTRRIPFSFFTPIVQAIRFGPDGLDGGADPSGDGMAAGL